MARFASLFSFKQRSSQRDPHRRKPQRCHATAAAGRRYPVDSWEPAASWARKSGDARCDVFARVARVPGYAAFRKLLQMIVKSMQSAQYAGWQATSTVV